MSKAGAKAAKVDAGAVGAELSITINRLRRRLRAETASSSTGWTWSQVSTLARVVDLGSTTTSELAAADHVRPQSMAETVAALKRGGLVTTQPDPTDGRKSMITATARGQEVVASVRASRRLWLAQAITTELTDDEQQTLHEATRILNRLANATMEGRND